MYSWQVYDLVHYETFSMDYMADAELTACLLIPLDNAHRNNGAFRITIHGGETETVPILVEDIFPCPPDSIKGLYINIPCSSSSLSFPANSTAGLWQDVESLIRKVINVTIRTTRDPNRNFQCHKMYLEVSLNIYLFHTQPTFHYFQSIKPFNTVPPSP